MASVCSVVPSAARWRVPNRSAWIVVSPSGRSAPAARILEPRTITAPSWSGDLRREDRPKQVRRQVAVDHHADLGDLLQARLALDHDERAVALGRQRCGRPGHLGGDVSTRAILGRHQPAQRADPADAVEGTAELRLEDDDEREQADDGAGLEDLGEQLQVEASGLRSTRRTGRHADDEANGARPRMRLKSQ